MSPCWIPASTASIPRWMVGKGIHYRRSAAQPHQDRSLDADQHGTHVCGTIGGGKTGDGVSIGVAPAANLYVAGVLVGNSTMEPWLKAFRGQSSRAPILSACLWDSITMSRSSRSFSKC